MKTSRAVCALAVGAFLLLSGGSVTAADATHAQETYLQKGEVVPTFRASGIDGRAWQADYKGKSTVLLFFLSSCPTCHKMLPEWNRAYERRPPGLNIVGVLMDQEPPGFFSATPVAFPVVRSPGRALLDAYKIVKVPVTLRVGPGGKVEDIAVGIVDPITLGAIFRP